MKHYEQIRAIRNKMFPPKLEFGCEVINVNIGNKLTVLDGDVFGGKVLHWNWNINEARVLKTENLKILGLPVSLNDILLMIDNNVFSLDPNGVLFKTYPFDDSAVQDAGYNSKYKKCPMDTEGILHIDLTLPIKDQTPETLRAIIKLIKD